MENGVRRWLVNTSNWNPSEDQFSFFLSFLPLHEQSAVMRFIKFEDKKRALVSRLLQYSLVHEVLGISFDKIIINRTIEGKPYLQNRENLIFPNFNFNSSHHGDYVGIASEPICLVGLDIVRNTIHKNETALEFINNFSSHFTDLEWKDINGARSSDEIMSVFYRYWCLKEAFVKATGAGVGFGLQRLEFRHRNWNSISIYVDGVESRDWRFSLFQLDEEHWAAVARGHPNGAVDSYKRTLSFFDFDEERDFDRCQDGGFISRSVEQLIPSNIGSVRG
ncbi:uncharacterized protein A4U43_C02F19810 [Asparagus officinalis]|uniref:holo-[acyl-carrier-protein] synthase n=1 Tax=Asparagus officinalis TaxID=4686 RepID=A0A5P1FPB4_ASPOF|nr:L-aminoadipate-semialdehyde dehydrogenase-phosphopantetheinyl transferase-like [Asparagus officinalis]XP_020252298.1 L-aminoadipate-semialdehyde dehydrogenase-phosphopantetheinyl transferase-like [Asparagus officinalis]XP_020252299.1 L-aminoadipate-semialdehyde dehydrogenase-phosphopantetheinyl transferase-like [Asparagus officinalis]ONK78531.1 uncharacterized protein A4U43_C02F19810 [Asparagus officinalis]